MDSRGELSHWLLDNALLRPAHVNVVLGAHFPGHLLQDGWVIGEVRLGIGGGLRDW